jgi:hypothetical protein
VSKKLMNQPKSILFFETRSSSFERFPLWISKSISQVYPNIQFNYLSNERFSESHKISLNQHFILNPKYFSIKIPTVEAFVKILNKLQPSIIVVFAHRLPDIALLVAARTLSIKTVYYQHGLYIPFMRREPSLFLRNLIKTLRYAIYGMSVGRHVGIGLFSGLSAYLKIFLGGRKIQHTRLPGDSITADCCLVYGEYWADYHQQEYGYSHESIKVVGTPDLSGIDLDSRVLMHCAKQSHCFCYVAQTLVEDGRLQRGKMLSFLDGLAKAIRDCETQLIVKLHPRSDISLYENLNCNLRLTHEFPASIGYIGHYSTILVRGIAFTEIFCLVNFPGHVIPEYIKLLASDVVDYSQIEKLTAWISGVLILSTDKDALFKKRQKIKKFFHSNDENPFDRAAHAILCLRAEIL